MDIRFERSFGRDLANIRDKKLLRRVKDIIDEVEGSGDLSSISQLKKLKGYDTYYRVRLGDYRIGIEVLGDTLIFVRFLHRREVYSFFP